MAARNALLKYLRVDVNPLLSLQNTRAGAGGLSQLIRRHFSEEARGSFLDKSEVTDRVLSVVKNFQKVDPSKGFKKDKKTSCSQAAAPTNQSSEFLPKFCAQGCNTH